MKFFTKDQLFAGGDVPPEALWIAAQILEWLATVDQPGVPKLLHVGLHDGEDDWSLYEVFLQFAPGLEIATRYGLSEDLAPDMTDEERETAEIEAQDGVVDWVEEAVQACMPLLPRLADIVHRGRMEARRILADWCSDGLRARVVDVRLAPYDHWRGGTEPALTVLVEAPGELLTPEVIEVQVEDPGRIAAELSELRQTVADRCVRSAELMAKGATGTISRLALNAIDSFGDREATVRRFATEWRFWLPDDTALLMRDGDVQAGNGRSDDLVDWYAGRITMDAGLVNLERSGTAIGRPVTELVDHEYLSQDMIVTAVSSDLVEGRPVLTIQFDMPRLLFCSVSGRVWKEEEEAADRVGKVAERGNIIPFRRLAG